MNKEIKDLLKENNLDGLLITSVPNLIYFTSYTGFFGGEREVFLLLTPTTNYIFTDFRLIDSLSSLSADFKLCEINTKNRLTDYLHSYTKGRKVGIESHDLTLAEYYYFKKELKKTTLKPTKGLIEKFRLVKQEDEIKNIKRACNLADECFAELIPSIKEGETEKSIAFGIEAYFKKKGEDISFPSIVAFGAHAAIPHHLPTNTKLISQNLILIDFGAKVSGYCSDMTRVVFTKSPSTRELKAYETTLEANEKAIEYIKKRLKENKKIESYSVDEVARNHILENGFPSIPHSLGHGVGIQIHEAPTLSPKSKDQLTDGMVFSIEPGIYIKSKFGIRIEDLVSIEKGNASVITKSPKKPLVIKL